MAKANCRKKTGLCEKSTLIATNFICMLSLPLSKMALRRPTPLSSKKLEEPRQEPDSSRTTNVKEVDSAGSKDEEMDAWAATYISRVRSKHEHALHSGSASSEFIPPPPTGPRRLTGRRILIN